MTTGLWEHWVLPGIWVTIQLTIFSAALGALVAFTVGMARTHRLRTVRFLAGFYTEIFRGTSSMVLMFWLFFVVPLLFGWQFVPTWAAVLALGLSYGAYGAEIVRGALNAVAPAQREAGVALNFTPAQRMRLILLPQAIPEMIPPFSNLLIELLKATALVSLLGIADTSFAAYLVRLATQESAKIYSISLVIYFVLAFVLSRGMRALERKTKANIGRPTEPGFFKNLSLNRTAGDTVASSAPRRALTRTGGAAMKTGTGGAARNTGTAGTSLNTSTGGASLNTSTGGAS